MPEKLTKKHAVSILKKVIDPELHVDIYNLELIYEIEVGSENEIKIKMTLTTPFCPYGPALLHEIKDKLKQKGFINPEVEVVFEPLWEPSEKVKILLGLQV